MRTTKVQHTHIFTYIYENNTNTLETAHTTLTPQCAAGRREWHMMRWERVRFMQHTLLV